MPACPHCQKNTIGLVSKFWTDAACPAQCSACGGLAYLPAHETTILNLIAYPGYFVVLLAVIFTNSLIPVFIWAALWIAALGHTLWRAPLVAISDTESANNKRYRNILIVLLAAAATIWWLFYH